MTKPALHIALLRGINVGGRNKLPMKQLVAVFEACGAEEVRTYIQSGNVVFRASASLAKGLPRLVSEAIAREAELEVPVVVRSARQLEAVVKNNPLLEPPIEPKFLAVGFLSRKPTSSRIASLDPDRSPPDLFVVRGSEIYLRCPAGAARSRLTNDWFDRRLGVISTMRNWNTVHKLLEMSR